MPEDSTDTVPLDFAERLAIGAWPWGGTERPHIRILPGALPDDLPLDLPLPPGARLLGSAIAADIVSDALADWLDGEGVDVYLDVPATGADVLAFYGEALVERGWTPAPSSTFERPPRVYRSGIQTSPTPSAPSQVFCSGLQGPWLVVRAYDDDAGISAVGIHVSTADYGLCVPRRDTPTARMTIEVETLQRIVPSFLSLPGVKGSSGGGGSTHWTTTATAETAMSVADLAEAFADRLLETGWTRRDSGAPRAVASSSWHLTDGGEWQGTLTVFEGPEPNERLLRFHLKRLAPPA